MNRSFPPVCCLLAVLWGSLAYGQTSYPMLMRLHPCSAQVGQTSEHELEARYNLHGATEVLISGEGVTGEIATPMTLKPGENRPNLSKIQIRFQVADDARPGVRDFRVMTPQGVSTLGQLVIVRDGVVVEAEKNDTASQAQEIPLPATICGGIERAEDVDFYKFRVEAGTSLNFHVRSMRLQDKIHDLQQHVDPLIALRNSTGTTLATSDNVYAGDPFLSHHFEHAGEYYLEIRDVRYQGNRYWTYSVEVNSRPFVSNVHPMGLAIGEEREVELVGSLLPEDPKRLVSVPSDASPGAWDLVLLGEGGKAMDPVPVVLTDLPAQLESDQPNNAPESAQAIEVPSGISGRIESPADLDTFAFTARKGERFSFEVIAHRQNSALDSQLRILDAKGRQLTENDDLRLGKRTFSDSWIENWSAPADGTYFLQIGDLNFRGGPDFVYFIQAMRAEPYFELYLDTDKTQLTPGTSGVLFVNAVPKNGFAGEIALEIEGLPEGVTASCGRILAGRRDGCIILQSAKTVSNIAANITVRGRSTLGEGNEAKQLTAITTPYQETYNPGGGRGHWPALMHTVAVGEPGDIRDVKLSEYDIRLKPGESKTIDITIERGPGFDKNVQLDLLYRHLSSVYADVLPPGVTMDARKSKTVLTGGATAGQITLTADPKAQNTEKQQVAVMANISINFVMKATYTSRPLFITVEK